LHKFNYTYFALFTIVFFNSGFHAFCQSIEPILNVYSKNLEKQTNKKLAILSEKTKVNWLNYIPRLSYDFDSQSLNIGYSLSDIARYYIQKKRNNIELQKLEASLQEASARKVSNLEDKIFDFNSRFEIIKIDTSSLNISRKIFQIAHGQYTNNEITTEVYLLKKLELSNKYKTILKNCISLEKTARKILKLTNNSEYLNRIINLKKLLTQEEKNLGVLGVTPLTKKENSLSPLFLFAFAMSRRCHLWQCGNPNLLNYV